MLLSFQLNKLLQDTQFCSKMNKDGDKNPILSDKTFFRQNKMFKLTYFVCQCFKLYSQIYKASE